MTVHLCTLVVIADTDGPLAAETLGPEAIELNIGLRHALVSEQKPGTEDWLGKDIEDSVGNDLLVNRGVAGAIGDTPDTVATVSVAKRSRALQKVSTYIGYTVQMMRVKPPMAAKKLPTLPPRFMAIPRP